MITNSEDRHFDAVGVLLERYDVTDPAAGKAAGTYAVPAIQDLYDGWLAEGRTSLEAAYRVGVELEQRDIADLNKSIAADLPADVDTVLGQLLKGSQNHLAAYQRAVAGDLGTGHRDDGRSLRRRHHLRPRRRAERQRQRHAATATACVVATAPGWAGTAPTPTTDAS